jgi:ketosteroid isomerase-like protein
MRRLSSVLAVALIFFLNCFAQDDDTQQKLSGLVLEEYAFAQTSLNEGIRKAFLTFLDDAAVIFTPEISNGKEWHSNRQPSDNILNWKPDFAEISVSGELGYTTGPWEFSKGNDPKNPIAFGHYVSIWQNQADSKWKVIVDIGISHNYLAEYNLENINTDDIKQPIKTDMNFNLSLEENKSSLEKADIEFARLSKSDGFKKAFITVASDDVRLYREEQMPACGKQAAIELIAEENNSAIWNPHMYGVSKAGDLGYTYGVEEFIKSEVEVEIVERSTYLRIWKKDSYGKWQLVLDITNPLHSNKDE